MSKSMDNFDLRVMGICNRLKTARLQAGLSQSQAAELLGLKGTASSISDIETYKNPVTVKRLLQFADIYEVDTVWLLTGSNPNFDRKAFNKFKNKYQHIGEEMDALEGLLESLTHTSTASKPKVFSIGSEVEVISDPGIKRIVRRIDNYTYYLYKDPVGEEAYTADELNHYIPF